MRTPFRAALLCVSLSLAACAPEPFAEGWQPGHYRIAEHTVEPFHPEDAEDPDFLLVKTQLEKRLPAAFAHRGKGREVGITLRIREASMEINTLPALLSRDSYRIFSSVVLWDATDHTPIVTRTVNAKIGGNGGPLSLLGHPLYSHEQLKERALDMYITNLILTLYPSVRN